MITTVTNVAEARGREASVARTSSVSAAALLRLCGAALIGGGVLAVLGHIVFHPPGHGLELQQSPRWVIAHALSMLSFLLGAVGALGLYVRVRDRAGVAGLIATTLLFFGLSFHAMSMQYDAFVVPAIAANNTAGLTAPGGALDGAPFLGFAWIVRYVVEVGGLLGFAVLMLLSGFARGGAVAMLLGSVVTALWVAGIGPGGLVIGIALTVLQVGLGWMGYRLWRDPREAQPAVEGTAGSALV